MPFSLSNQEEFTNLQIDFFIFISNQGLHMSILRYKSITLNKQLDIRGAEIIS